MSYNVGDKFLYYGARRKLHGNLGEVIDKHKHTAPYFSGTDRYTYVTKVEGCKEYLVINKNKMQRVYPINPDWEV